MDLLAGRALCHSLEALRARDGVASLDRDDYACGGERVVQARASVVEGDRRRHWPVRAADPASPFLLALSHQPDPLADEEIFLYPHSPS